MYDEEGIWIRGFSPLGLEGQQGKASIFVTLRIRHKAGARQDGGGSRTCLKRTRHQGHERHVLPLRIYARNTASQ